MKLSLLWTICKAALRGRSPARANQQQRTGSVQFSNLEHAVSQNVVQIFEAPEEGCLQATNRAALQEMLGQVSSRASAKPASSESEASAKNHESPEERAAATDGIEALAASLPGFERQSARRTTLLLRNLGHLPTLASVVKKLRSLPRQSLAVPDILEAVRHDAALTTRLLRLANTAAMGVSEPVHDLPQAIQLLGAQRVHFYLRSTQTIQEFNALGGSFQWRHFWMHSLACALLAEECAGLFSLRCDDSVYLGGLLHDVGKLLFALLFPQPYADILMGAHDWDLQLSAAETWAFGMSHESLGALFATEQELPPALADIIHFHAAPEQTTKAMVSTNLVALSNALCKRYGLGYSGSTLAGLPHQLNQMPGWQKLSSISPRPPSEDSFLQQMKPIISRVEPQIHLLATS